jgi:PucR C-terminal helix-turn-helix domain/GGDEF-like domain
LVQAGGHIFRQRANRVRPARAYAPQVLGQLEQIDDPATSPAAIHAAMIEALVAGEGLERVAEIAAAQAGAPVGIYVPRPGTEGADGTAAERYVSELVAGDNPVRPEEAVEVAPIVCAGELSGAVVMLADDAEPSPEAGTYLRVAATAALTAIAMMNARDETARTLGASFLGELIGRKDTRVDDVLRRAGLLGLDLSDGLVALCAEPRQGMPAPLVAVVESSGPQAFAEVVDRRLFALVPGRPAAARRLAERLADHASVFLSSHYEEAGDARLALEEAELLAEARASAASGHTFRLLFRLGASRPAELRRFGEEVLGPVVGHDDRHATELELTLRSYLESDCNMNLTAQSTYTHRHTVSNRLTRVRELTGLDPLRSEDRELLGLALKARRLLALRPARDEVAFSPA